MVRSRRSISKEDACSVLADSGISLSSPPAAPVPLDEYEEEALIETLCVSDDEQQQTTARTTTTTKLPQTSVQPAKNVTARKRRVGKQLKLKLQSKSLRKSKVRQAASVAANNSPTQLVADNCKLESTSSACSATNSTEAEADPAPPSSKKSRKAHICATCSKEFCGNTDLKRHMLIHSGERPHKCAQCSKSYRQAVNLKNHITTAHQGQKQFSCTLCPKTFALKERLRLHMRVHSGEKPYACGECDKRFARGGQLQQHLVTHHQNSAKPFVCEKCSASFSSASNLRAHMERHEQGPEHYCEICNEHFPNDVILRAHVNKVHYKLRQFDCEVCKQTIDGEDLATHMKNHSNLKMQICEVCNSYFTRKSQYNVHMRMHTGERPFQCRICWQTFAHSSVLKLHIRKHTGEKPFNCLLCKDEVAFSQLAHLKTHMKKIHKQHNPYMCETCNEFFKIKVDLQAHLQHCGSQSPNTEQENAKNADMQTLSHLRFLIALLLTKISSAQKLQQLGYEKRLIDNVVVASLKLANRKAHDDHKLAAIERMRLNVQELLDWIVPTKVMQNFREEQLSVECILDKIVTMYMKQK